MTTESEFPNPAPKGPLEHSDEQIPGEPGDRQAAQNPQGFADETEPTWAPPEHQPEPRPTEPILNRSQPPTSNPRSTNTNSPA